MHWLYASINKANKHRCDLYQEKEDNPYILFLFHIFSGQSNLTHCTKGVRVGLIT